MKKESKIDLKDTKKVDDKQELNLWKRGFTPQEIGRAHVRTPVTRGSRMPSSA